MNGQRASKIKRYLKQQRVPSPAAYPRMKRWWAWLLPKDRAYISRQMESGNAVLAAFVHEDGMDTPTPGAPPPKLSNKHWRTKLRKAKAVAAVTAAALPEVEW